MWIVPVPDAALTPFSQGRSKAMVPCSFIHPRGVFYLAGTLPTPRRSKDLGYLILRLHENLADVSDV